MAIFYSFVRNRRWEKKREGSEGRRETYTTIDVNENKVWTETQPSTTANIKKTRQDQKLLQTLRHLWELHLQ